MSSSDILRVFFQEFDFFGFLATDLTFFIGTLAKRWLTPEFLAGFLSSHRFCAKILPFRGFFVENPSILWSPYNNLIFVSTFAEILFLFRFLSGFTFSRISSQELVFFGILAKIWIPLEFLVGFSFFKVFCAQISSFRGFFAMNLSIPGCFVNNLNFVGILAKILILIGFLVWFCNLKNFLARSWIFLHRIFFSRVSR